MANRVRRQLEENFVAIFRRADIIDVSCAPQMFLLGMRTGSPELHVLWPKHDLRLVRLHAHLFGKLQHQLMFTI